MLLYKRSGNNLGERPQQRARTLFDFGKSNKMSEAFFNGGGHKNAAGGHLDCSMGEAIELVKKAIHEYKPLLLEKNSY